jgi:muramoyltetrapeptide carboxypeptidase
MHLISIIAPSYHISKKELEKIKDNIKKIGFKNHKIHISGEKFFNKWAGTEKERLKNIKKAINSNSRVIFCAKGGSGSLQFLPKLKIKNPKTKKIIIGYSDISPLLITLSNKKNILAFHGPNALKEIDKTTLSSLKDIFKIKNYGITFKTNKKYSTSIIKGKTVVGNLERVIQLQKYRKVNFRKKIIFLEEIDSTEHKIFNLLMDLKNQKTFKPRAILFGNLGIKNKKLMREMISYLFPEIPLIFDLPFGHQEPNIPIPLNTNCVINPKKKKITFLFSKKQKKFAINLEE